MTRLFTTFTLIFFISFSLTSLSQTAPNNALHFDGSNDVVTVANASGQISTGTNYSMSCWIYPTKNGGPNGIVGFRNNVNADFYLLQLNNTSMECRFRNSSGTVFDIVYTGYTLNQWQHYVFTYDGSTLTLYKNGVSVGTQAASGSITTTTENLLIGNLIWQTSNFQYGGRVDEVSLWDKTLSASEVNCIYNYGIDPASANLKLYYDFNHGVANSNNSGITTLIDRAGNINGALTNFTLSGTTSNWTAGRSTPTLSSQTICFGDSVVFGGKAYYNPGTYFLAINVAGGCDSIVSLQLNVDYARVKMNADICKGTAYSFAGQLFTATGTYYDTVQSATLCDTIYELDLRVRTDYLDSLSTVVCYGDTFTWDGENLTTEGLYTHSYQSRFGCDSIRKIYVDVDTVNTGISLNGNSLFANADQSQHTYQWFNCTDGFNVNAATQKFYSLPDLKEYAVIVKRTATGCSDTSECLGLITGSKELDLNDQFIIFPNPAKEHLSIYSGNVPLQKVLEIRIIDVTGKEVGNHHIQNAENINIPIPHLESGLYFVNIIMENELFTTKFIVE